MNFKKAGIFRRGFEEAEQPEMQADSGGMLAVWGSPGSGKTVTAVKLAKLLSARKKNVILLSSPGRGIISCLFRPLPV